MGFTCTSCETTGYAAYEDGSGCVRCDSSTSGFDSTTMDCTCAAASDGYYYEALSDMTTAGGYATNKSCVTCPTGSFVHIGAAQTYGASHTQQRHVCHNIGCRWERMACGCTYTSREKNNFALSHEARVGGMPDVWRLTIPSWQLDTRIRRTATRASRVRTRTWPSAAASVRASRATPPQARPPSARRCASRPHRPARSRRGTRR